MSEEDLQPERAMTDESLAVERSKTDVAFAEKAAIERTADALVERARKQADEVLTTARAEADEKLHHSRTSDEAVLAEERAKEDQVLENMRHMADLVLRREREVHARVLARLLPLERDKTDQHLLLERARADTELANRDDFLGMVSHDLRDLLAGIVLSSTWIGEKIGTQEHDRDTRVAVERIQRSAARMERLIGDLVDIAGIDAGKLAIVASQGSASDVVLESIRTWEPQALAKGLTLEASVPGQVMACFDHERILQVLGNLITNAIKFSPQGASVVVGVHEVDGEVRFSVRDAGVGIDQDKLEAIFERFWQVGKNDRRGLGLGLYISQCLVEAHGGRIWVESERGVGSTFYFTVAGPSRANR